MPPTRKQSNRTGSPPPTPRRTKRVKLSKPVPNTEETPAQTEVPEAPPAAHNEPDSIEQAADPETNKEKTDNEELPTVESIPEPTTDTTNTSFNVVVGNTQAEPTLTSTEDEQRKDEPKPEADEQKDEQKDKQPKPSAKAPQEPSLLRPPEFDDGLSSELSSLPDTPAPEPAPESKPESATAPAPAPTESKAESNVDSKPDPTSSPAWPGWCTIESEPAVFNHLLHSIGVSGAQVTELYSLDASSLLALGRCYGIIFLFRYLPSSASYADLPCPPGIWFANQVTANACATLALLNIVFNSPVTLSPSLKAFKEFSADLTPPLRGLAVANNERIRDIHNGFGKKMEMVDADIELAEAAGTRLAKGAWKEEETEEGGAFHFVAFVKKEGMVWELDGLRKQPRVVKDLGKKAATKPETKSETKSGKQSKAQSKAQSVQSVQSENKDPQPQAPPNSTTESDPDDSGFVSGSANSSTSNPSSAGPNHSSTTSTSGLSSIPPSTTAPQEEQDDEENWTTHILPVLQAKIAQHAASELGFNLLAIIPETSSSSDGNTKDVKEDYEEIARRRVVDHEAFVARACEILGKMEGGVGVYLQ